MGYPGVVISWCIVKFALPLVWLGYLQSPTTAEHNSRCFFYHSLFLCVLSDVNFAV